MSDPYYADATVTIHHGDCLDVLRELPDASVDAVVTDPPYNLSFMGSAWDSFGRAIDQTSSYVAPGMPGGGGEKNTYLKGRGATIADSSRSNVPFQEWCLAWATECLRVLKPGGHMLAFGGTRTSHRLACAVEDAGFEIRDSIAWLYGSGFPKSLDVSKAIDKAAGAEREVVGSKLGQPGYSDTPTTGRMLPTLTEGGGAGYLDVTAPATDAARTWQGWGTALKPAHEPIVVARKPLAGTVAANVLAHGTGALNVDGCRVGRIEGDRTDYGLSNGATAGIGYHGLDGRTPYDGSAGRWPANVVLDESQAAALDAQSGELTSGANPTRRGSDKFRDAYGDFTGQEECEPARGADSGGASRFMYVAKAAADERVRVDGTAHPTVKPLALMRWLVRLVTPPGGTVLEPFAGSGTTVEACILEGFACIAIEREADYLPLIRQRIHRRRDPVEAVRGSGEDAGLFDLLGGEGA